MNTKTLTKTHTYIYIYIVYIHSNITIYTICIKTIVFICTFIKYHIYIHHYYRIQIRLYLYNAYINICIYIICGKF